MQTRECIKSRRSIRRFTEEKLADDMILELLEAIRWSPSWANTQCWEVIIVREQESKEKVVSFFSPNNPATKGGLEAAALFIMCGRKEIAGYKAGDASTNKGDWYMFDLGIACQNLCLVAHDLGLGTVHVGSVDHQGLDKFLGLPPGIESVEVIPIGYPAKEGKVPPRKSLEDFVYLEKYGDRYK